MLTRSWRRRGYAAGAGLLAVAGALALPASAQASLPGASAVLTRAPYLTDMTTSSLQVSWATTTQSKGVVEYGAPGNCTAGSVTSATLGTPITVNGVTEYLNSVAVTGLSAGTGYCYRITTGGSSPVDLLGSNASPGFTTLQPAAGSQPLTFDVLGDWGDTTDSGVNDGSTNANQAGVDARIAASGAQFAITAGDLAYPGGTQTDYGDLNQTGADISAVFGPSYWAVPGQSIPLYPASGNHGKNATFLQEWPESATVLASGGTYAMVNYPSIDGSVPGSYPATYYAFSTGGVRFYMLDAAWGDSATGTATGGACGSPCAMYEVDHDAHWAPSSAEYQWLAADLAAHPGGLKLAFFHFPLHSDNPTQPTDPYLDNTPGSTGSLEQLLHDNGVQLVFNGHTHTYERNIAGPGGVTSYVTGGGGAKAEPVSGCSSTDAYAIGWSYSSGKGSACGAATAPTADAQVYHFLKVTVNGTTVTVTPTNSQGQAFDAHIYNFAPDTTPPSAPGNLTATQPQSTETVLNWTAATDNIGVSAYDIYRDGSHLATVGPGVASYTDASAAAGAMYTYQVAARDLAGNTTNASVTVNGSTDTTPPSAPANLTATSPGAATVALSWGASTDNVGVTGYTILRGGSPVATVPGTATSYTDIGLTPGTQYAYQVTASDAAGNVSQPSNQATATTQAALFYDGFETGDLSQWTTVSGLTVQSALARGGNFAARETSTGTATYAYKTLGSSYTSLWAQAWVYVVSHSTSAAFFDFRASNGGSIVYVYVNASGMLSLRNDTGGVTTYSTTPVTTGSWHLVTMHAVINGTSGSVTASLDGTQVPALTLTGQNLGTNPITKLQLGDTTTGRTYDVALDQVTVTQSAP